MHVGLISDTHGYLDPRAVELLRGVELILHAGDVGSLKVVEELARLAPVRAVRGNVDEGGEAGVLPLVEEFTLENLSVHLVHQLDPRNLPAVDIVVFGHSHRALVQERDGRLLLNPGAAGRRGFHSTFTVGLLDIIQGRPEARIVEFGSRAGDRVGVS
ncbi:MAG: metallophosphoesterase family protein [Dehalococcoidia bacterium]